LIYDKLSIIYPLLPKNSDFRHKKTNDSYNKVS